MNFRKHCQFPAKARYIPSLALALVSLLAAGEAKAATFNFTRIATTSPNTNVTYDDLERGLGTSGGLRLYNLATDPNYQAGKGVAINKGGRVAYHAQTTTTNGTVVQGIYTYNGAPGIVNAPRLIVDTTQHNIVSLGQGISINQDGSVAFVATLGDGSTGIYTKENSLAPLKLIAREADYGVFAPGVSINDSGEVAFTARKNGVVNVFKGKPGVPPTPITNCTGTTGNQCPVVFEAPSINNLGWVSFSSKNGIYAGDGNFVSPLISGNPAFVEGSYREANISDFNGGTVSGFLKVLPSATPIGGWDGNPGQAIMSGDGTNGSVIAGNYFEPGIAHSGHWDPTSAHFISMGTSSINNNGNVAFMANQSNPEDFKYKKGIFIGSHAIDDKVIGLGDTLLGAKVVDLAMDRESLSDDNEISFWAKLDNGFEGIFRANEFGSSQFNPWLPNCPVQDIKTMSFCGVTSGRWYDPPTAYGFHYEMDSDSLFTSILDLPSTFENPFTVMVEDIALGEFSSGDEINFNLYADLLGDLLVDGSGVKRFTVRTNDAIDPTDPMALPIKLAFNTDIADFTLSPVEGEKVPEPGMILGLLSVGAFLVSSRLQRK